jgi:hypothetical protein
VNAPPKDTSLFDAEKASWLKEGGAQELDAEQRALLLALAQLEAALGHDLSEDETEALDALGEQLPGFDAQDIAQAMQKVVDAPTDPNRETSWSELKQDS